MNLSRREFGLQSAKGALALFLLRTLQVGAVAGVAVAEAGCSVWTDILNWVPVAEAAVKSILTVLTANGVVISPAIQAVISLVYAALDALQGAIKEYQSATPPPVGALAKIQEAFNAVVDNFSTFLKSLNVSGGLLAIITGLAEIIFSTIFAFMNRLPAPVAALRTAVLKGAVQVSSATVPIIPKERSRRVFKRDYNSVLYSGPAVGAVVPKVAYLHISLFDRMP